MQGRPQQVEARAHTAVLAAWAISLLVVCGFVVLRFVVGTQGSATFAQLLFLTGPLLGGSFAGAAAWVSPRASQPMMVWSLLSLTMWVLLVSEGIYSQQALRGYSGEIGLGAADALNVIALLLMLAMLMTALDVRSRGRRWAALVSTNALILAVALFALVYSAWITHIDDRIPATDAMIFVLYPLAGLLLLVLSRLVWSDLSATHLAIHARLVLIGLMMYGTGLVLWPAWRLSTMGVQSVLWAGVTVNVLFLASYLLVFVAGVYRLEHPSEVWIGDVSAAAKVTSPYADMLVSTVVVVCVVATGWGAFHAPHGSADKIVYLSVMYFSALLLVVRTTLLAYQDEGVKKRLETDRTTGARNPRSFESRVAEFVASAERFGEDFVVVLVDLDGFAQFNAQFGTEAGDRVLAQVVTVLSEWLDGIGHVFRLSGDEFAVLASVDDADAASWVATLVRGLVRSVYTDGPVLDCSVGYAICPDDAIGYESLVAKADTALAWVKRRGGGQVARHNPAMSPALDVERSPGDPERDSQLEMARALSAAADARDPSNYLHSRNVAAVARLLAEEIGFEDEHLERVQIAGLLHDVGKIALPLTDRKVRGRSLTQRELVREHARLGARMVESLGLPDIPVWVLHHHERWDGSGYPDGLSGDAIPLESQILSLANYYDSRTSGAHYGAPMSKRAALQEVDLNIGTRFNPELAELFIRMIATHKAFDWDDRWPAA